MTVTTGVRLPEQASPCKFNLDGSAQHAFPPYAAKLFSAEAVALWAAHRS